MRGTLLPYICRADSRRYRRKPRSTVQETYAQIMNDINKAVERLNGTTRKHISHIDYATALGLQARIALVMEDWATLKNHRKKLLL